MSIDDSIDNAHRSSRRRGSVDSYVVRIYRQADDDPEKIAGIVESVERDERNSFNSHAELRTLLNRQARPGWKKARKK